MVLEDNPDQSQVSCKPQQKRLQTSSSAEDAVPSTSAPVIKSPGEPAKKLEAQEIEQKERHNPISYWAAHLTWPKNFAEHNLMASSNTTNKRQRTLDSNDPRSRSYSQSRKDGKVPEQYTAAYQAHILTKGLDMDCGKGRNFTSKENRGTCAELLRIDIDTIGPTAVPQDKITDMNTAAKTGIRG